MQAFKSMIILALPFLVVATPLTTRTNSPASCNANTGKAQCCNKIEKASDSGVASLLGLLGIIGQLTDNLNVGFQCNPILLGGNSCSQQAVCCTNDKFNGLVVLGCSPLNVGL